MSSEPTVSVIIPVYRGETYLPRLLASIRGQSLRCDELLLVVTDSTAEIEALARSAGARHLSVERARFDHAGTRSEAVATTAGEVLVFLTQDVLPAHDTTLETLVDSLLADDGIGAAYGRQIPDEEASPSAKVKRLFNYPDASMTKGSDDRDHLGLRTPFISNAFAAYRRSALEAIGGFGSRELICEDVCAGAALLSRGWSIHYAADAVVHHTHHFSLGQEFQRYFDIGVAHHRHRWILEEFGGSDREGLRYLGVGIDYLGSHGEWFRIPDFILRGLSGRMAYLLGRNHGRIPRSWCRSLSSFPDWWDRLQADPDRR
jgi:polysaccharide biosynthesis protein PslC